MMLAPLTDYKNAITLIQDSGIQFLDFALTPVLDADFPGKFVRQTASGPLLRLQWHADSGQYRGAGMPGTEHGHVDPSGGASSRTSCTRSVAHRRRSASRTG